jgi:peptidyl-prolyl cis-trans isomerase SurA
MKLRIALIALIYLSISTGNAQDNEVLLTIDNQQVTSKEFMTVYQKNNVDIQTAEKKSIEEYLELYINFKLKVIEAESLGLDTVQSFRKELDGYVNQLTEPYLVDRDYEEALIREAYDRLQEEVNVSHIMIRVRNGATPEDTLKAWNTINNLYDSAIVAPSFEELALETSEDPSVKDNNGNLGYFTAFRMVYPFENAAYQTNPGNISRPFRTTFGYHIVKVYDVRPARGELRTAYIMLISNDQSTEAEKKEAERKIQEIYSELKQGANFTEMARVYSEDRGSSRKGGELPWFSTGRMVPEFEEAAFSIEKDGDISEPVKTQFGWHIIKRLEYRKMGSYEEEYKSLKSKVEKDKRSRGSRESLIRKLKIEYKVKTYPKAKEPFVALVDTSFFKGSWDESRAEGLNSRIMTLTDKTYSGEKKTYTQKDFAQYIKSKSRKSPIRDSRQTVNELFDQFVGEMIIEHEKSVLKLKYDDFRLLANEYHDGILLFEIMEQKVWKKALKDTAGLEKYYNTHKNEHMWGQRVDATLYYCENDSLSNIVMDNLEKGRADTAILSRTNKTSALAVSLKKGRFEKDEIEELSKIGWQENSIQKINSNNRSVVIRIREILDPQPKELDEVRGIMASGYQDELDKMWIEELRAKYPVEVNQEALDRLIVEN